MRRLMRQICHLFSNEKCLIDIMVFIRLADLDVAHKMRKEFPLLMARRKDVYAKYDSI